MNDFKKWQEEADIPMQDENGKWYDAETGFYYENNSGVQKKSFKISEAAKESRNVAKKFGAKALKGTPKQKEWAEKIRAEFLLKISSKHAENLCSLAACDNAKFWIEKRHFSVVDIENLADRGIYLFLRIRDLNMKYEATIIVDNRRIIQNYEEIKPLKDEIKELANEFNNLFG